MHVSVRTSCCFHMIICGTPICYSILCVSNQHIGGYHGSHGSKWIFGLIPPLWFPALSHLCSQPVIPHPSYIMNTFLSSWHSFTSHLYFCLRPTPSFAVTFQPSALQTFIPPAAFPSLSSTRAETVSYLGENCRVLWPLIKFQFTQKNKTNHLFRTLCMDFYMVDQFWVHLVKAHFLKNESCFKYGASINAFKWLSYMTHYMLSMSRQHCK